MLQLVAWTLKMEAVLSFEDVSEESEESEETETARSSGIIHC
jgi:hypothetical protein